MAGSSVFTQIDRRCDAYVPAFLRASLSMAGPTYGWCPETGDQREEDPMDRKRRSVRTAEEGPRSNGFSARQDSIVLVGLLLG